MKVYFNLTILYVYTHARMAIVDDLRKNYF